MAVSPWIAHLYFLIILFRAPCLPRRPKGDRLAALMALTNLFGLPSLLTTLLLWV